MEGLTQRELEQPVKGYQLLAVEKQLIEHNKLLSTIVSNTLSIITEKQLEAAIKKSEENTAKELENAVKKIHLTYGPMKRNITWFLMAIAGEAIAIIAQLISLNSHK